MWNNKTAHNHKPNLTGCDGYRNVHLPWSNHKFIVELDASQHSIRQNGALEFAHNIKTQGAVSIRKTVLPGMAIPMLKIRRPNGRLIFNMEIAIRR